MAASRWAAAWVRFRSLRLIRCMAWVAQGWAGRFHQPRPAGFGRSERRQPMMGQAGQMGIMTPMGRAQMGGGSMQPLGHQGDPAVIPSRGSCGRGTCHAGQNARRLPKAPTTGLGSKGKLLILFAVLGVLALAMVLFVIFSSHK